MYLPFTKMQGAGNDFVVLDETRGTYGLTAAQYQWLADRRFGVGADQILTVRAVSPQLRAQGVDFEYVIHNADGSEVEQCGNGARCFVRFVREKGLTAKDSVTVKVKHGVITLRMNADQRVTVNMGAPVFALPQVPFDPAFAQPVPGSSWPVWQLGAHEGAQGDAAAAAQPVAVLSMGNPHAVQFVAGDVDQAPVDTVGPWVESHPAFPQRVNAGFLQVLSRDSTRIRVFERGSGETLACGTGACAAVVAGIRLGLLDARVDVQARGGRLTIEWSGDLAAPVFMTGPAETVFHGEVNVPDALGRPAAAPAPVADEA
ncbi:diaminopimelate epimerase [Comamonas serinivorans]|uniref:Diaminopimelate epimerase n=1 Tax=Comamonas serinivorans TaxID=1082851 RepID=A0A1Y0ERH2_9BURK|nr:diaminopimelate epimerase [Comamonas serinivorans]ARU06254.1 diaminopimelate epimerase [Comamonas serinivorans]